MISASNDLNKYVSKDDLIEKSGDLNVLDVSPCVKAEDKIIRGNIDFMSLQNGLKVHFANASDLQDLEIARECAPRLSVSFFLEGFIEAYTGPDRIPMPEYDEESATWSPIASIFSQCQPEIFRRHAKRGSHLKKIVISISPQWLDKFHSNTPEYKCLKTFSETHLARKNWTPSPQSIAMVEQIITSTNMPEVLRKLYVESRVIMLLEEAFRELIGYESDDRLQHIRPQDRERLKTVETYLQTHEGYQISTKELAEKAGVSTNSLQRLLTKAYGMSASKFIRTFMLEKARNKMERDGISIAEASYLAGYNSPANFATAFKKCFGFSPSNLTDI